MSKSKKFLSVWLLLGIVAVLGIAWGISSAEASPFSKPKPSPTPKVLENGWHQFTDAEAGYSFSYLPDSLSISIGKDKGEKYNHLSIQFSKVDGYGYQGMVVRVIPNPKKLSVEDFLLTEFTGISNATSKKKSPPKNLSSAELGEYFTIGGQRAIKTTIPDYRYESTPYFFYIQNNDNIIATAPLYGLMNASALAPEAEEVFIQILNTFTFNP
jgi:hypothetical protein